MKTKGYFLMIAGIALLVVIVSATGNAFLLLWIPPLLFLYVIGRVLVAVVRWLER